MGTQITKEHIGMTEKGRRGTLFLWCYTERSFPWRDQADQDTWELKEETPQLSENSVLRSGINGIHIKPGKLNTDTGRHQPCQQLGQFWGQFSPGQVALGRKPGDFSPACFAKLKIILTTMLVLSPCWYG